MQQDELQQSARVASIVLRKAPTVARYDALAAGIRETEGNRYGAGFFGEVPLK